MRVVRTVHEYVYVYCVRGACTCASQLRSNQPVGDLAAGSPLGVKKKPLVCQRASTAAILAASASASSACAVERMRRTHAAASGSGFCAASSSIRPKTRRAAGSTVGTTPPSESARKACIVGCAGPSSLRRVGVRVRFRARFRVRVWVRVRFLGCDFGSGQG